ncbi:hypothetical protein SAMN02745196_01206 [Clostridium collagenovorans DSM 3089]|uniref:Uncharacterized protein n=1 Tax=Clostridium collagenovorans DSM 3089 TaxID=1121306 RepID=A0A1M5VB30_9CLOT|nr:hypothetical protein [Clostridium collagenovorans]SHH72449.1 hypothetical protein SAMN02745196_01206 [Clostridium collagenovorans DSM 3089]
MYLDFLDSYHIRMKKIGAYSILFRNSIRKDRWKKYGFEEYDQDNMLFSVLLYIMEQSLKEEICTLDNIASFIDDINSMYYGKAIIYEECKELGDFIINNVLCNEGKPMYFEAFNYNDSKYESINISFVRNSIEYVDGVKRVSYKLTDNGYSLLLSTLELEENLRFTVNEIIFREHLKKADYGKAVDDIKDIFKDFRKRVQKIESDILRIRENPLSYSIEEYKKITEGNVELLDSSKKKYIAHREHVDEKIKEFNEKNINIEELNKEEEANLEKLKIIYDYLSRTIDEDQRILRSHFSLKEVYSRELENMSKMSLIERFNLKKEVYDKILNDLNKIENIDILLRPLFVNEPEKIYNLNKALVYEMGKKGKCGDDNEIISFDEDEFALDEEKRKQDKLAKYKGVINVILELALEKDSISLGEIKELLDESNELMSRLIPNVQIFREVVIEMLKNKMISVEEIRKERKNTIENDEIAFQLNRCILDVIEENSVLSKIEFINVEKIENSEDIKLKDLKDENGEYKNFICSNILFEIKI